MSFAGASSGLNESLALSVGDKITGRVNIRFPSVMSWYQALQCTQFQSFEHRKEPKGFKHEFIVLKLSDGSICRIERMGDPNALADTISEEGSTAYDIIQCYTQDKIADAKLHTSEVVAEVYLPEVLDLVDVLKICRAIQENEKTLNYTLQTFNCYFFALTIQSCLTRFVAGWEADDICLPWISALQKATESLSEQLPFSPQEHQSLLSRVCFILYPRSNWPIEESTGDALLKLLENYRSPEYLQGFKERLKCALNNELWNSSLDVAGAQLLKEDITKTITDAVCKRFREGKLYLAIV